jgi:hypothetical protein
MIRKADRLSLPRKFYAEKASTLRPPSDHRHRRSLLYFRKEHHGRRLRATFGTPEFWAEYNAALDGSAPEPAKSPMQASSLRWLWDRYRETTAWSNLSHATRRQRENIMRNVLVKSGAKPFTSSRVPTLWRPVTRSERRHRLAATSSILCAACLSGRSKHSTSRSTLLLASRLRLGRRAGAG